MPTGTFSLLPATTFPLIARDALWSDCSHTPSNSRAGNTGCTPSDLLLSTLTRDGGREREKGRLGCFRSEKKKNLVGEKVCREENREELSRIKKIIK